MLPLENEAKNGINLSQTVNGLQRTNLIQGLDYGRDWQGMVRRDKVSRMGQANLKTPSHIMNVDP